MDFWGQNAEIHFFKKELDRVSSPERLFYKLPNGYFAYAPKGESTKGQTLQSRNAPIGNYTEEWCNKFLQPIANELNLFAVNGVVCSELGLSKNTAADIAFCTTRETTQSPRNIKLIFEIKMSVVNNYSYNREKGALKFEGDYKTHKGLPSLRRSDSMLKAIGKAINIRLADACLTDNPTPIVVIGNAPISKNYGKKIDFLKQSGIVQSFISLYPNPTSSFIKETTGKGFRTFGDYRPLQQFIMELVTSETSFFSSALPKGVMGSIIKTSAEEVTNIATAEKFLQLLKERE